MKTLTVIFLTIILGCGIIIVHEIKLAKENKIISQCYEIATWVSKFDKDGEPIQYMSNYPNRYLFVKVDTQEYVIFNQKSSSMYYYDWSCWEVYQTSQNAKRSQAVKKIISYL